ncbi:MAG: DUF5000 domain-containing lipoprotein [Prolixibacteraceae bacterium]|jgi:hypothetical protein
MKNYIYLLIFFLGSILLSCEVDPIGQISTDSVAPGAVSNVKVENIAGGAILTYTLPDDEDLLYVKAVYSLKDGVTSEVKASLYTDTLVVKGFGDTKVRSVSLIAIDRSKNESKAVETSIEPLEPAVITIGKTLRLVEDFGGVHAYWENPTRAEISVMILKEDNNKEYVPIEVFYSTVAMGEGAARGLDTLKGNFGIVVQDRWENQSEVKYDTLTPLFEQQFDRLKFKEVLLPNDEPSAWGWVLSNVWDGIIGDQGFHTANGSGRWPQAFTIDLGVTGKISRIKEYQRQGEWIYKHGNIKKFEVWGAATLDPSGNWDSWTKLIDCESIKPSGLPMGQFSAEDEAWAAAGEEFINSPENPAIRFLRIRVTENWSGGDFFHFSELEIFGDNRY